jgi:GNAT superfamily N-acetyltransferase
MTLAQDTILRRTFTMPGAGEILIREAGSEYAEGLQRMFSRCSQETIYLRFHLPLASVSEWLIALLVGRTEGGGLALVAVCGNEIFGHAMYVRDEESDHEAEFAIVVEDDRQARGLGTLLISEITEEARQAGIETLTGTVLAKNRRILNLTRCVLPDRTCSFRSGTCVIRAVGGSPDRDKVGRRKRSMNFHTADADRSHNGTDFPEWRRNDH